MRRLTKKEREILTRVNRRRRKKYPEDELMVEYRTISVNEGGPKYFTVALVETHTGEILLGASKRNPIDKDTPSIGRNIAFRRAFQ